MSKQTDIPERILKLLEGTTEAEGLTVTQVANELKEPERTVRGHLETLVENKRLHRKFFFPAYRHFRVAKAPKSRTPASRR